MFDGDATSSDPSGDHHHAPPAETEVQNTATGTLMITTYHKGKQGKSVDANRGLTSQQASALQEDHKSTVDVKAIAGVHFMYKQIGKKAEINEVFVPDDASASTDRVTSDPNQWETVQIYPCESATISGGC